MTNLNFATIAGRLTANPETRQNQNGSTRTMFSVAVNRGRDNTDFIPVQMLGAPSEKLAEQLVKGAPVLVSGRFEVQNYQKDGETRPFAVLNADTVRISNGNFNNITVDGNLVADPEVRTTPNGKSVVNLRIANNRSYRTKDGEWKDAPVSFLNVVLWEQQADFVAKYFKKGDGIIVGGRLTSRRYETKAGEKRTAYDIVANEVSFGGKPKAKDGQAAAPAAAAQTPAPAAQPVNNAVDANEFMVIDDDCDDLPF